MLKPNIYTSALLICGMLAYIARHVYENGSINLRRASQRKTEYTTIQVFPTVLAINAEEIETAEERDWATKGKINPERVLNNNSVETTEQDSDCDVKLAPLNSLPVVALASRPGCGNTWTRHLIEMTTGLYTGSIYASGVIYKNGFLGEKESYRNGRTVVIKTHRFDKTMIKEFEKAIVLLRNPYNCFIAEYNRENANMTIAAPEESFRGKEWEDFVVSQTWRWEKFASNWLQSDIPVLVIHYENLRDNLLSEMRRVSRFLNVTLFESRVDCLLNDPVGKFKRTGVDHSHIKTERYSEKMQEIINKVILETNKLLKRNKYPLMHA